MKLDRNINGDGRGKYGIVNNRRLREILATVGESWNAKNMSEVDAMRVREAARLLERVGVLDWGTTPETEFFLIKLRDEYARAAIASYAVAAAGDDAEYSAEVFKLADRSGVNHPLCKKPD